MTDDNDSAIPSQETGLLAALPPRARNLGDMLIWPVDGAGARFFFLPLRPGIARNPDGSDQLGLIVAGDIAFLQISTDWTVSDIRLEEIRAELEAELETSVILSFAPVTQVRALLFVHDLTTALAAVSTSGMPPYNAMFHQQLEGAQRSHVEAALAGQAGQMMLRYEATLGLSHAQSIAFHGVLDGSASHQTLRAALDAGRAVFDPPLAQGAALDGLLDQALTLLQTSDVVDHTGSFSLSLSQTGPADHPILAEADLAKGRSTSDFFDTVLPSQGVPDTP